MKVSQVSDRIYYLFKVTIYLMLAVALHLVMSMILAFEYMLHEYFS